MITKTLATICSDLKYSSATHLRTLKETVFNMFNKYAPIRRKYVRANEAPFMSFTKQLWKCLDQEISFWRTELKIIKRTSQRSFCKKFLRTTKKSYCSNLDIKNVTDNKTLWKTIISFFTKRPLKGEKN